MWLLLTLVAAFVVVVCVDGVQNSCGSTLCFSGTFSDHAVLQRAPSKAALFGSVPAAWPGVGITDGVAGCNHPCSGFVNLDSSPVPAGHLLEKDFQRLFGGNVPKEVKTGLVYAGVLYYTSLWIFF